MHNVRGDALTFSKVDNNLAFFCGKRGYDLTFRKVVDNAVHICGILRPEKITGGASFQSTAPTTAKAQHPSRLKHSIQAGHTSKATASKHGLPHSVGVRVSVAPPPTTHHHSAYFIIKNENTLQL